MKVRFQSLAVWLCVVAMGLALVVGPARAQIISGDLVGTVFDKTGATVPGAKVVATNTETSVRHETTANTQGEYRFTNLPVGIYNVTASAANFATTSVNGFKVELNKTSTLPITLEVSAASTTIEVSGGAVALDTTTAQLSSTFEDQAAAVLPSATSGSGVLNLSLLSSGVASSGGVGAGSGPSVGGQRPRNNNFTIEGVDNNNKSVTGPLVYVPNDAVAEFSLLQNNFGAEYGHSSGGQFNTVVKSGTNDFHGMAYIYNNNRDYNALDTHLAAQGVGSGANCSSQGFGACSSPGPRYDFNRIGGQVGGPVIKNKLFFFVNYEYDPLGAAGSAGSVCAPDAAGWNVIDGTSGLNATNVAVFKKYVPVGTVPTASCTPTLFTAAAAAAGGSTCKPGAAGCVTTQGLSFAAPNYTNSKYLTTSGDWDITSKDQLRARYIWNNVTGLDTAAGLPTFWLSSPTKYFLVTINEYHQFTASVQNEFRVGFNRYYNVTPVGNTPFSSAVPQFPNLTFYDLGQLNVGPDPNGPQSTIQNTYQFSDAVSWTKGRHSAKFGFEGRKIISPQFFIQRSRGDYYYNTIYQYMTDAQPDNFAERSIGAHPYYGDQTAWYWFAQDNWRVTQNFTLNLGVRYEYTTIPYSQRLQNLNAIASVPGLVDFREPSAATNNWAPRIGFAWSPGHDGKTSVRAGFGEAFDVLYDNLGILSTPPELSQTVDCNLPGTPPGQGGYYCDGVNNPLYANGFLAGGGLPSTGNTSFPDQKSAAKVTSAYVPVNQKSPKSIDWTLGVQHAFANDYTFEIRYVGTRGIHLPAQIRLNNNAQTTDTVFLPTYLQMPTQAALNALPYNLSGIKHGAYGNPASKYVPAWAAGNFKGSSVVAFEPWASSTYNGLAMQLTKKFSHGLQFVGSYTFSHAIDDATADVFSTVIAPRRAQDWLNISADRSNSILDHRQRFTLALVYDVPYFKNSNWFMKNLVGNWTIAPIYTYQSGQWGTAQNAVDTNLNGDSAGDRPIFNGHGTPGTGSGVSPLCTSALPAFATCGENDYDGVNPPGPGNFNSQPYMVAYVAKNGNAQYIVAAAGAKSTVGRSTLQLNSINDIDMTVSKRLNITERVAVQFQAQSFNLFNHPQFVGGYLNDVGSIGFTGAERNMLIPTNPSFNKPQDVFSSNPRTLQLGLKVSF